MLSTAVMIVAIRSRWDLSHHAWFWIVMSIIAGLHVPLVLFTRWPQGGYPGFALWLPAVVDFAVIYSLVKAMERVVQPKIRDSFPR
jgi:hypothetical protein